MDDPLWTICIATLASRREKLARLLAVLLPQCEAAGVVEVLAAHDNGQTPIAVKRQALLMAAAGKYVSFVDDDDMVDPWFVPEVHAAIGTAVGPDYVAFEHAYYVSGARQPVRVLTGLQHKTWHDEPGIAYRDVTHINPARTALARQADFTAVSEGAEDWAYDTVIRRLAETQVEAAPGRPLYHYFHDPADSAQRSLAPHQDLPRAVVASPCFRWIDL